MFGKTITENLIEVIKAGAGTAMTHIQFLETEILKWRSSPCRLEQIKGERYYLGYHDILSKRRKAIGKDGKPIVIDNLPNNKVLDNQYALHVDRKVNYIVGKPFLYSTMNEEYAQALATVFNRKFMRTMRTLSRYAVNGGLAWLCPHYDEKGKFAFKVFPSYECLPFWSDKEHTALDMLVRLYEIYTYRGRNLEVIEKVEVYTLNGIEKYELANGHLVADVENPSSAYFVYEENGVEIPMNWEKIPVIPFKYNSAEKPLLRDCKSLQDGINQMQSKFQDNMQTDAWSTIIVLTNYDGQNLGEFRQNLAQYGAVKVRSDGSGHGGVDKLEIEVNSTNYETILNLFKKKLIENARSFDAKDDRVGSNANQMNLQSMYSDIDLDANGMETEFQASFEDLMFFINAHLSHTGQGDFGNESLEIQFDRDMLMNETDIISNIRNSVGIISNETLVEAHPYVTDPEKELSRLKAQQKDDYADIIGGNGNEE